GWSIRESPMRLKRSTRWSRVSPSRSKLPHLRCEGENGEVYSRRPEWLEGQVSLEGIVDRPDRSCQLPGVDCLRAQLGRIGQSACDKGFAASANHFALPQCHRDSGGCGRLRPRGGCFRLL